MKTWDILGLSLGSGDNGISAVKMSFNWNPMGKEERSQRGHRKRLVSERGKVTVGNQEKKCLCFQHVWVI